MNNAAFISEDTLQKSLFHVKWSAVRVRAQCPEHSGRHEDDWSVSVAGVTLKKYSPQEERTEHAFFLTEWESVVTSSLQIQVTLPLVLRNYILKWQFSQSCIFLFFIFFCNFGSELIQDADMMSDSPSLTNFCEMVRWWVGGSWLIDRLPELFCWHETFSDKVVSSVTDSKFLPNSPTWKLYRSPDDYLQQQPLKQHSKSIDC